MSGQYAGCQGGRRHCKAPWRHFRSLRCHHVPCFREMVLSRRHPGMDLSRPTSTGELPVTVKRSPLAGPASTSTTAVADIFHSRSSSQAGSALDGAKRATGKTAVYYKKFPCSRVWRGKLRHTTKLRSTGCCLPRRLLHWVWRGRGRRRCRGRQL